MRYTSLILAAALVPSITAAGDIPTAEILSTQSYDTEQEAAIAAIKEALPLSNTYEHGGVIVLFRERYYYTIPVNSNTKKNMTFHVKPTSGTPIAIYHTHPVVTKMVTEENPLTFSYHDVKFANTYKITSYLGVMADKSIRVYVPNSTPTINDGIGKVYSFGTIIGKVEF